MNTHNYSQQFDIVSAMEVIEHVNNPSYFIEDIASLVKPNGYLLLSTINKNQLSYLCMILAAEKIFGMIPEGTHDWSKFLTPEELTNILQQNKFKIKNISGVFYNPITTEMSLINDTSLNYILIAKKM